MTNMTKSEKRAGRLKKYYVSMEITRVKLNPEQAVLSCCDSTRRQEVMTGGQCDAPVICTTGAGGLHTVSS